MQRALRIPADHRGNMTGPPAEPKSSAGGTVRQIPRPAGARALWVQTIADKVRRPSQPEPKLAAPSDGSRDRRGQQAVWVRADRRGGAAIRGGRGGACPALSRPPEASPARV